MSFQTRRAAHASTPQLVVYKANMPRWGKCGTQHCTGRCVVYAPTVKGVCLPGCSQLFFDCVCQVVRVLDSHCATQRGSAFQGSLLRCCLQPVYQQCNSTQWVMHMPQSHRNTAHVMAASAATHMLQCVTLPTTGWHARRLPTLSRVCAHVRTRV